MSSRAQVTCSQCNTDNPYSVLVCWMCGAKLPFADVVATAQHTPQSRIEVRQSRGRAVWQVIRKHLNTANRYVNLLAVILWIVVVIACGFFLLHNTMPAGDMPDTTITLSKFEQLQTGMTYKECMNTLGRPGVQQDLTYIRSSGLTITTYLWQNPDGSNAMTEFENGRLTTRAQAGLHKRQQVAE
jgi:hypothetical protein